MEFVRVCQCGTKLEMSAVLRVVPNKSKQIRRDFAEEMLQCQNQRFTSDPDSKEPHH